MGFSGTRNKVDIEKAYSLLTKNVERIEGMTETVRSTVTSDIPNTRHDHQCGTH